MNEQSILFFYKSPKNEDFLCVNVKDVDMQMVYTYFLGDLKLCVNFVFNFKVLHNFPSQV